MNNLILASAEGAGAIIIFLMLFVFYFLPTIVSGLRHHHNDKAIFVTNLLLGWTMLGWIVALIWACTNPIPSKE
jgi:uncharacterized membrane protein YqaE (UPF0057 family)